MTAVAAGTARTTARTTAGAPASTTAGATAGAARPAARPAGRGPALRVVPARRSVAGRTSFGLALAALVVGGLLALLALNTVLAQDAFTLHELQVTGKQLSDREQSLATQVRDLEAPAAITERAGELGLVQSGAPGFLLLPEGRVLGDPAPAVAPSPAAQEAP